MKKLVIDALIFTPAFEILVSKKEKPKHESIKSTLSNEDNRRNLISRKPQAETARTVESTNKELPRRLDDGFSKNLPDLCNKIFSAPRGKAFFDVSYTV